MRPRTYQKYWSNAKITSKIHTVGLRNIYYFSFGITAFQQDSQVCRRALEGLKHKYLFRALGWRVRGRLLPFLYPTPLPPQGEVGIMTSKSTAALRAAGGLGASRLAEYFKNKVKCKMDAKFLPRMVFSHKATNRGSKNPQDPESPGPVPGSPGPVPGSPGSVPGSPGPVRGPRPGVP